MRRRLHEEAGTAVLAPAGCVASEVAGLARSPSRPVALAYRAEVRHLYEAEHETAPGPGMTLLDIAKHLAVAALAGLIVGVEREWSGHADGPDARFAGVRTFLLLGLLGGMVGWLTLTGWWVVSGTLLAGGAALVVVAYATAARRTAESIDGTTEVAALVVLATGVAAGFGYMALAGGAATVTVIVLAEKTRIHGLLRKVDERELRAGLLFAAISLVVLPILPEGPYGPWGGVRPRWLWTIVVVFSGINFLGYVARRVIGAERGYGVAGMIGGVISSTAVTLNFARASRREPAMSGPLALGVVGACTVLLPRITIMSFVLNAAVGRALVAYLLPGLVVGAAIVVLALGRHNGATQPAPQDDNPLRLLSAIQMALLFQVALTGSTLAAGYFGSRGVISSAVILGLTDMDALTVSMNELGSSAPMILLAAKAIAVGVLTNTAFKTAVALVVGSGRFRWLVLGGLGALGAASVLGLWIGARLA